MIKDKRTIPRQSRIFRHVSHLWSLKKRLGLYYAVKFRFAQHFKARSVKVRLFREHVTIRPNWLDLEVAFESLGGEFDGLKGLLPPTYSGIILDAGGFIGTAAIALSRLYPNAKIVSIEASIKNFEFLKLNVNNINNIFPIHAALMPKSSGFVELHDSGNGDWGFSTVTKKEYDVYAAPETVKTICINTVRNRFGGDRVGILKLDIEGGELDIFIENREILDEIPIIFVELHDRIIPGCEKEFRAISENRIVTDIGGEKMLSIAPAFGGAVN